MVKGPSRTTGRRGGAASKGSKEGASWFWRWFWYIFSWRLPFTVGVGGTAVFLSWLVTNPSRQLDPELTGSIGLSNPQDLTANMAKASTAVHSDDDLVHRGLNVFCDRIKMSAMSAEDVKLFRKDSYTAFNSAPLFVAAHAGDLEVVVKLLSVGEDPRKDESAFDGSTPMHVAAKRGFVEIMSVLMDMGKADPMAESNAGFTPLHLAAAFGQEAAVQLLIDKGTPVDIGMGIGVRTTPLNLAAEAGIVAMVKMLLKLGADPNADTHASSLRLAAGSGFKGVVELLLDYGADPDHQHADDGVTALVMAVKKNHRGVVEVLLEDGGAEPNLRTGTARTGSALLVASQFGHLDLAELLLSYGADPNHMTIDGITALMSAALDGHLEIVQLLLGNHANPHYLGRIKDGEPFTARELAQINRHHAIVRVIQKAESKWTAEHGLDKKCMIELPSRAACNPTYFDKVELPPAGGKGSDAPVEESACVSNDCCYDPRQEPHCYHARKD